MSWHYRARRNVDEFGEYYDVVEYYGENTYTVLGIQPIGDTLEALTKELERMLADVKMRPVLEV
jgi:hypothetical protein